jgi:hypothetical protein
MAKQTAGGKQATKEEQPFDLAKSTEEHRIEVAGGIPVGIFTEEEREERRAQLEKEGRIPDPPETRNPTTESEKLLDQQAQSVLRDREVLKERRAQDVEDQAEAQREAEKAAKAAQKESDKEAKSHHK